MSEEAVTRRMIELNQLWELAVALRSSDLGNSELVEKLNENNAGVTARIVQTQNSPKPFDLSAK
ncbi:MAG TPA: hypothetical protein PLP21_14055 [Pyrinomonadaceae bacterium]|nr:hypothetical protein [Pyrinomonadaceae bacterium]